MFHQIPRISEPRGPGRAMRHEVTAGAEARWRTRRTRRRASGVARPLVGQRSRADITRCPPGAACGTAGRMRVLDVVTDPDNPPRLPYAPRRPTAACGGGSTRRDGLRGRMRSYVLRTAHKQTNGRKRFLRTRLVSRCPPGPAQPTLHEPLGPHPQRPAPRALAGPTAPTSACMSTSTVWSPTGLSRSEAPKLTSCPRPRRRRSG